MPSAPTTCDPPGRRRLGGYVLLRRIAVGGMAEVFEARPDGDGPDAGAPVVIKALLPQLARDAELVRMMEHEALLSADLSHPNLVRFVELGSEGSLPFLVLERVDGLSLDRLLASLRRAGRESALDRDVAALVAGDLLRALGFLHGARGGDGRPLGVVHRDVSPHNLLLSRRGEVKLGDLGIARSAHRADRTRTGVIKGKLRYLAPEQVTGSSVDGRTDLYGAGLVLWELLTGAPYLQGEGEVELLRRAEAPPQRRLDDPALGPVVRRALARFPEERFQSAAAFLDALERAAPVTDPEGARRAIARLVEEAIELDGDAFEHEHEHEHEHEPEHGHGAGGEATRALGAARRAARRWPLGLGLAGAAALALLAALWLVQVNRAPPRSPGAAAPAHAAPRAEAEVPREVPGASAAVAPHAEAPPRPLAEAGAPASVRDPPRRRRESQPVAAELDASAAGDAGQIASGVEAGPPGPAAEEIARRLAAIRAGLSRRGVDPADLEPGQRAALRDVEALAAQGHRVEAGAALARLEPELAAVRVDQELLRRKLARVDARLGEARRRGAAGTAEAEDLAATALQDFMDGRYEAANRRLNQILRLLDGGADQPQRPVSGSQSGRSAGQAPPAP